MFWGRRRVLLAASYLSHKTSGCDLEGVSPVTLSHLTSLLLLLPFLHFKNGASDSMCISYSSELQSLNNLVPWNNQQSPLWGQELGGCSASFMKFQPDVNWDLQSSESLTGADGSTSKMAHSWGRQRVSSPWRPLHGAAGRVSSRNNSWLHPEQEIQKTKIEVAVTFCLPLEVTHHHLCHVLLVTQGSSIQCGEEWHKGRPGGFYNPTHPTG